MDLKELKEVWREHGFRANKKLGQNFLVDKNVKNNILNALPLKAGSTVVEIGSGFGMMSFDLASRCGKLFAVEKDPGICEIMAPLFREQKNITLIRDDILRLDLCGLAGREEHIIVFGNIPYYVSTPIIAKIIEQRNCIDGAYIVLQEEVASRIVSPPGSKEYGSISCFAQFYTSPKKLLRIKRNSFYPKPQVESCLLALEILRSPGVQVKDKELMFKIIRKAFSERRKKIVNPLSGGGFMPLKKDKWKEILETCGIDASSRAENLSLSDYARLADEVGESLKRGQ